VALTWSPYNDKSGADLSQKNFRDESFSVHAGGMVSEGWAVMNPQNPKPASDRSVGSDRSDGSSGKAAPSPLRPGGGYRGLRSFRAASLVYDATVAFCARFLDPRSRTVDQMVQAARSGRQNIAEGSRASRNSSQTELRLVGVARASLDELLLDYEDFLRQRKMRQWAKEDPEAKAVCAVAAYRGETENRSDPTDPSDDAAAYRQWLGHKDPAVVANAIVCLIHQANYLLDRQLRALERDFITEDGYTERLAAARIEHRREEHRTDRTDPTDRSDASSPACPACGGRMALRTARTGRHTGKTFWGCMGYPDCRGIRPAGPSAPAS
jgi:restriction system protein